MPRPGAKPTPTVIRRLRGHTDRTQDNTQEAMPSKEISLEPPAWAELTEEGVKVWFRLAPRVHRNGLLTECDLQPFARYCDMLPRWYKMKRFLDEHGETYEVVAPIYEGSGRERTVVDYKVIRIAMRPQQKLYLELNKAISDLEREFGLTPSSRSRIAAAGDDNLPEDMDFYFGGKRRNGG